MADKVLELQEKRKTIWDQMKALNDKTHEEKRDFTGDETSQYEKMNADMKTLNDDIKVINDRDERSKFLDGQNDFGDAVGTPLDLEHGEGAQPNRATGEQEVRALAVKFNSNGRKALDDKEYNTMQNSIFHRYLTGGEKAITADEVSANRALAMDQDIYGGYLVTPQEFADEMIKTKDRMFIVRQFATKHAVPNAASLGMVSLDNDPADAAWTKEIGTGNEDSTMSVGKRELNPHPLAKLIKVSAKLLRASARNVEGLVQERMAYKHAYPEENAFINGTGAGQPLGLMVASDDGIATGRDVSTDNAATSITGDGLIECKHKVRSAYRVNCRWLFHDDAIKQIRKLKNGEGQYIWQAGLRGDATDTLLGQPVHESEFMPNTFTTGLYVGIYGDFSYYHIADALNMQIQRLAELYAETNQVGYIGRLETDGMPVLSEAFARVKLG